MNFVNLAMTGVMAVWYPYVRKLNAIWPYRNVDGRRYVILPGVYKPLENEHACADYCREGDTVLDLGCGCGIGAIVCADKARHVLAVDISAAAVRNTIANCEQFGIRNVTTKQSDMFAAVDGQFDLIIANPPYIAADFQDEEAQYATSVRYLPALFESVGEHLAPGGRLLVQFPLRHASRLIALAEGKGLRFEALKRMPEKSLGLKLLSLAYLQVGFQSTFYLFVVPEKARDSSGEDSAAQSRLAA